MLGFVYFDKTTGYGASLGGSKTRKHNILRVFMSDFINI